MNNKVTSESIRKALSPHPINWSKLSESLAGEGKKYAIRGDINARDPIPEKYFKPLLEMIDFFESWNKKHCE